MAAEVIEVKSEGQLQQCLEIRKEVFVEEQQVPLEEEIDELDHLDAESNHILITVDGQVAATGRIKWLDETTAKMQRIAVLKPFRGSGIGRSLMVALEQLARSMGAEKSVLDGQCQAEGFYHSLGYVTVSEEPFYDAGILHVRMEKKL
ncbi:GNAT family N-acetyltransferase [Paenibacillus dendritiformis]|uniref:GCN5-like N-acetyltransferase n=1 Tax=Paenibacillus dendritiformis C454 TaxID=1131935 RepID=H3SPR0_9BACL|nr:GNAT family N-acetyltransferase [Paenibacillus dendritiformis]EHQ58931.1 GCN5-like N-acetyltransferase [Paenibacillus dendritiformis C454]PZM62741.1 GNAT family N-acetyltransferase [Paenibacillus dendritiformis]CAH8769792.1 GNAT family N-acetyltransferase [Paenibacillus dendritiformis]